MALPPYVRVIPPPNVNHILYVRTAEGVEDFSPTDEAPLYVIANERGRIIL